MNKKSEPKRNPKIGDKLYCCSNDKVLNAHVGHIYEIKDCAEYNLGILSC
jgi:hypothetical protein